MLHRYTKIINKIKYIVRSRGVIYRGYILHAHTMPLVLIWKSGVTGVTV